MKCAFLSFLVLFALIPAAHPQLNELQKQLDQISRNVDIRNRIDAEYSAMTLELSQLGDYRVAVIMQPHIKEILRLNAKLREKQRPH